MFIFGLRAHEVPGAREQRSSFQPDTTFTRACEMVRSGTFGWTDYFTPLLNSIEGQGASDFYLLANDFKSYCEAQRRVDETYRDQAKWNKMSILSVAGSGKFSSDRTIKEYA